ncbi:MAG TPA: glycerate kinase [Clostridiales bacterium]|nr:glycerate kinase [Clostridiales bacterium]
MRRIILVPDSFKGTMSSAEVCDIMSRAVRLRFPGAEAVSIPVADGGEGSVDAFLSAVGGRKVYVRVKGPYFEDLESFYGILPDNTAVVEMAAASGLPLVEGNKHPGKTTTYGAGQLIVHAARSGCKKIIVGLGGSATNDGGCGAAAAAGVVFRDASGKEFIPVGETLNSISSIDMSGIDRSVAEAEIITMCDIDNPLYGPDGAAFVFAPQKGADEAMVKVLDENLRHLAGIVKRDLGTDISAIPGAGAAGGMGGGMAAFFGSRLKMGIETVLDVTGFDRLLEGADLVITGEGKIDSQSLRGKVITGVARRAKKAGVPVIAVAGDIDDDIAGIYDEGVAAVFSINRKAVPFEEARLRCRGDLFRTVDNLMRFLSCRETSLQR